MTALETMEAWSSATQTLRDWNHLDALEQKIAQHPQVEMPVRHIFTPGLYCREITMPAGTLLTSKIHKTEHQFIVSKGRVLVHDNNTAIEIEAPFHGITKPGTRRVLYVISDCIWTTCHPTTETDVAKIEEQIILKHDAHLCPGSPSALPLEQP